MQEQHMERNFTIKAVILSLLLAILLASSNAYLALKIGTTISASIPAAVLSIGIFRFFKHYSVFECNLVQTAASAGEGMAAAVAFVLPAMVILHFWNHFNYWLTTSIICLGGLLGVFLSIPLRRVFLGLPGLKYPEGTAIGNVLKVSTQKAGLMKYLLKGIGAGGIASFLQQGMQVAASAWPFWWQSRGLLFGMTMGFDPAAFAAGFIIGPEVNLSLLLGVIVGWVILIPVLSVWFGIPGAESAYGAVNLLWSSHLRYVGVGTMLVGGLWTLIKLIKPIIDGVKVSFSLLGKRHLMAEQERDIPMLWMVLGVLVFSACIFILLAMMVTHLHLVLSPHFIVTIAVVTLLFIMLIGFLLATICGYVVGIIGSTNSPISGMLIISILLLGLVYLALFSLNNAGEIAQVVGLLLLVTTIVGTIAAISNENMQDLKAGQMIGATPWKQQVMLALGVIAASFVVAPVLELLYHAYGIGGVFPRPGMDPSQMLAAPQANLMATIAQGILTHHLEWNLVILGMAIALVGIIIDECICRRFLKFRIIVLAFGLAIYLPPEIMLPMVIGGFLNLVTHRLLVRRKLALETIRKDMEAKNLTACGMVAGASLMGVFLAIPFVISGNVNILTPSFALNPHYGWLLGALGLLTLLALIKILLQQK